MLNSSITVSKKINRLNSSITVSERINRLNSSIAVSKRINWLNSSNTVGESLVFLPVLFNQVPDFVPNLQGLSVERVVLQEFPALWQGDLIKTIYIAFKVKFNALYFILGERTPWS